MAGEPAEEKSPEDADQASATAADDVEDAWMADYRAQMVDGHLLPDDLLREMRRADLEDERQRRENVASQSSITTPASSSSTSTFGGGSASGGTPVRLGPGGRQWETIQTANVRPGAVSVGGMSDGRIEEVGEMDEFELMERRINAVHKVQGSLNARLGYDLRASGAYEETARAFEEGELAMASTGLEHGRGGDGGDGKQTKVGPSLTRWSAPPPRERAVAKEPSLPYLPPDPLPIHWHSGASDAALAAAGDAPPNGGIGSGGGAELVMGKFINPGPDWYDDEEKREEGDTISWSGSRGSSSVSWADSSTYTKDCSPLGPYERVVRCWKCQAGLKVGINTGLVSCPRCRTVSPAS